MLSCIQTTTTNCGWESFHFGCPIKAGMFFLTIRHSKAVCTVRCVLYHHTTTLKIHGLFSSRLVRVYNAQFWS